MKTSESKMKILNVSLDLFSQKGFEGTSVAEIAENVGIKKASLYSHFDSKQEIFETLIELINEEYEKRSFFSNFDWDDPYKDYGEYLKKTDEEYVDVVLKHIEYLVSDPQIIKTRKLLSIEQFSNGMAKVLQEKRSYESVIKFYTGLFTYLIQNDIFIKEDPRLLAIEFCSPISIELQRIDRNNEVKLEALSLIKRHALHFFRTYRK